MANRRRFDRAPSGNRGVDLANTYCNVGKSTAATTAQLVLDAAGPRGGGDRHGHVLWTLDIKNGSGADGRVYLGGLFESSTTDAYGSTPAAVDSKPNPHLWGAGTWDQSATPKFSDDTAKAKSAGGFSVRTATTNDGFVVHATRPFSCVVPVLSAASGTGVVIEATYWDGDSFEALTLLTSSPTLTSTGDNPIIFAKPTDWIKTTSTNTALASGTDVAGLPADRYVVRFRASTASGTATASSVLVGDVLRYPISIIDNGGGGNGNDIGWPLCSEDERPWAVFGAPASGWEVGIGTERTLAAQVLGEGR